MQQSNNRRHVASRASNFDRRLLDLAARVPKEAAHISVRNLETLRVNQINELAPVQLRYRFQLQHILLVLSLFRQGNANDVAWRQVANVQFDRTRFPAIVVLRGRSTVREYHHVVLQLRDVTEARPTSNRVWPKIFSIGVEDER